MNSPEIVRRQILHYNKIGLPPSVDVTFVDDGSIPSLSLAVGCKFNCRVIATNDFRKWTQPKARNFGVKKATGEYVLCVDLDHIIPIETIDFLLSDHGYDQVRFKREVGILDENGDFIQDMDVMREWGLLPERGLKLPPHGNSFAIKRNLYLKLDGVSEKHVGSGKHPNREEAPFKRKLKKLHNTGEISILKDDTKPKIYMFPNGMYCGDKDHNPFGLFHDLKRMTR